MAPISQYTPTRIYTGQGSFLRKYLEAKAEQDLQMRKCSIVQYNALSEQMNVRL